MIRLKLIGLKGPRVDQDITDHDLLLLASLLLISQKIPSETEVAPRYALLTLFILFVLFTLFTLFKLLTLKCVMEWVMGDGVDTP